MSELIAGKILKNPKYMQLVKQRDTLREYQQLYA